MSTYDPDEFRRACRHFEAVDPVLAALAEGVEGLPLSPPRSAYESLARAIVGQQLSTKAAATIWSRFVEHHGTPLSPTAVLQTEVDVHRALGISGQKEGYLRSLAEHVLEDPEGFDNVSTLEDEDIIRRWTRVKGLGRWTVQMHLMFQLGRPDVFPVDDLGIRRAMERHCDVPRDSAKGVYEKRALVWGPFRTAACRLLWMSLDNQPK